MSILPIRLIVAATLVVVAPAAIGRAQTVRQAAQTAADETLSRTIALRLDHVALTEALRIIGREAGLSITFGTDVVPSSRVSLVASRISVGEALLTLLDGTGLTAVVVAPGVITLRPDADVGASVDRAAGRRSGSVSGLVTDSVIGAPIAYANLRVDETGQGAVTGRDGRYAIAGLVAGTYHVTARRVGYVAKTQPVTVVDSGITTLNVMLHQQATRLDEIVTTASGDQRRLEVGNAIVTINADSLAKNAPVLDFTDVLSGRASNVDVESTSGEVGSGPIIRIRGVSSVELANDPVIIIDGFRVNNQPGSLNPAFPGSTSFLVNTPSRLNDIDPSEIESIEVLKGPSAATLYGTDAATGVIVVTTHHGHAGAPQWHTAAEHGGSQTPTGRFPLRYYGWGHTTDATHAATDCSQVSPIQLSVAAGTCTVDSITSFQPLRDRSTSIFGPGYDNRLLGSVNGGVGQLTYALSGSITDQTGNLRLPPVFRPQAIAQGIPLTTDFVRPNALDQKTLHAQLAVPIARTLDASLTTSIVSAGQRGTEGGYPVYHAILSPGVKDSIYFGYYPGAYASPLTNFQPLATEGIDRTTTGGTLTWRPLAWITAHATGGLDIGTTTDVGFLPPRTDATGVSLNPATGASGQGFNANARSTTDVYTVDAGASFAPTIPGPFTSRTAIGTQYVDTRQTGTVATAYGLSANGSLNGAATEVTHQTGVEAVTLGTFIEETIGYHDRLYVTGGLREDAGSGFGSQVNYVLYPKVSGSWKAWSTSSASLRLRAAYGASGVQPQAGATYSLYTPITGVVNHTTVSADTELSIANQRLKPERSTEFEGGFDASAFGDRLTIEATYYHKLSRDALVPFTQAASTGLLTQQINLGEVRNYGVELGVSAAILESRLVTWSVQLSGSINTNRLVTLGPGVPPILEPYFGYYRQEAGYPLYGYWGRSVIYRDANHDGYIEPGEVHMSDSAHFVGQPLPPRQLALSSSASLWRGRVRLGVQFDARGGNRLFDLARATADIFPGSGATYRPHAPLADQATAVIQSLTDAFGLVPYYEDASFIRWRELSVTYQLPLVASRSVGARAMSVTVGARNLALWSPYRGGDPEVTTLGTWAPDFLNDQGSVPQPVSWMVRVNLDW